MKENFSEEKKDNTPNWVYRWGLRALGAAFSLAGVFSLDSSLSGKLTAAGHEAVPWVAVGTIATGVLCIGASLLK